MEVGLAVFIFGVKLFIADSDDNSSACLDVLLEPTKQPVDDQLEL